MKTTINKAWYIWITCCGVFGTLMFGIVAWLFIAVVRGQIAD